MLPVLGDAGARDSHTCSSARWRHSLGSGIAYSSAFPYCLPVSKPQRFELEIWDVGPRPQGEQIDNPEPHIDDGEPILLVLSH